MPPASDAALTHSLCSPVEVILGCSLWKPLAGIHVRYGSMAGVLTVASGSHNLRHVVAGALARAVDEHHIEEGRV